MAKPLSLNNGRNWPTRTAAKAHFKKILSSYIDGQIIVEQSDHSDLAALLEYYDSVITNNAPTKIGQGIHHFERQSNLELGFPTSGFWVHRIDNSKTDFSYIDAVDGKSR